MMEKMNKIETNKNTENGPIVKKMPQVYFTSDL